MEYNIYFDVASIFISLILIFSVVFRKTYKTNSGKIFLGLIIVTLLSAICDFCNVVCKTFAGIYIANIFYFLTRNMTSLIYCIYLIGLTDTWHKMRHKLWLRLLIIIPYFIVVVFVLTNPFTSFIFSVEGSEYSRGPLIHVLYVCSFAYLFIGFVMITKYRKMFTIDKLVSLYALFPLTIASLVVQFLFPTWLVEIFFTSLALLFLTITIERPEESLDFETGMKNYSAFVLDSKKAALTKKIVTIVVGYVINCKSFRTLLSYEELNCIKRNIASIFKDVLYEHGLTGELYYLKNGKYCVVLNERYREKGKAFSEDLRIRLNSPMVTTYGSIDLISNVALVQCPEDINTHHSFLQFLENFGFGEDYINQIVELASLKDDQDFQIINELDSIIELAVHQKKFEVYYQPIYSLKDKKFKSAEALLRLKHDTYGYIPPSIFIPAAEKSGAIHKIGELVIEQVCEFISSEEFKKMGLEYIEINLSVIQCMHEDLYNKIKDIIQRYDIKPKTINFEITETADSFSYQMVFENISKLYQSGFAFSLDDYGTGYSNMERISYLPLQIIKIDKAFVSSIENPKMQLILQHSIQMMKSLNLEIVVEGIETKEMVDLFEKLDCDYIQGYYYSKPIPKDEFIEFIKKHNLY